MREKLSHPVYKPPLRFVLRLRLQKGGGGIFVGHYGITYVESIKFDSGAMVDMVL